MRIFKKRKKKLKLKEIVKYLSKINDNESFINLIIILAYDKDRYSDLEKYKINKIVNIFLNENPEFKDAVSNSNLE